MTTTTTLSTLIQFDDLRRCMEVFMDGTAEEQFLRFAKYQEECRLQWVSAVQEAHRLQNELDASLENMADLETKLFLARRLLEKEIKARRDAEQDRNQLEKKLIAVAEFIQNSKIPSSESREHLEFLKSIPKKRKSATSAQLEEKYKNFSVGGLVNDINSTGSLLSDLSVTHSEEDFLDMSSSRTWKKHRPSLSENTGTFVGNKGKSRISTERRRSSRNILQQQQDHHKYTELNKNDKICATTKVSIPENGPIRAESIIEAMPSSMYFSSQSPVKKAMAAMSSQPTTSSEPMTSDDKTSTDEFFDAKNKHLNSPTRSQSPNKKQFVAMTPTAPPYQEFNLFKGSATAPSKNTLKRSLRGHNFSTKTFIKSDICTQCQKKIRFGSAGLKCKDCRLCIHLDCRDKLNLACVPTGSSSTNGTPIQKGSNLFLTDYAPPISPMIPAIIVHLVNEIESRGLNEVGLYRLSGSEREVKSLKEKFLRGKKPQNLTNVDIHVLCSCMKDFLRCLREPLIPTDLWSDFSNAVENSKGDQISKDLQRAVNRLPQANRDTLAFLLLHFQRVAQCPEVKMPLENLARVFGPTILGYSSTDPRPDQILNEIRVLIQIMDNLLKIPSEYWCQFTQFSDSDFYDRATFLYPKTPSKNEAATSIYATPFRGTLKKDRKFYGTPPLPSKKSKF